jgi:hypothetical protein
VEVIHSTEKRTPTDFFVRILVKRRVHGWNWVRDLQLLTTNEAGRPGAPIADKNFAANWSHFVQADLERGLSQANPSQRGLNVITTPTAIEPGGIFLLKPFAKIGHSQRFITEFR